MPAYGIPGVHIDRKHSVVVGIVVFAVVVVVVLAATGYRAMAPQKGLSVILHTEQIGDGIENGTDVRLDGVAIGKVTEIAPADFGTQRIHLQLDADRLHGIDDSLRIDYAPANLFGISEIELRRGPGGEPLHAGIEINLTGDRAVDVYDATMGNLLRNLSQVSTTVLTPQLSTLIARLATDLRAFTPFLQSTVMLARTLVDNQRLNPSVLLGNFGDALGPTSKLVDATVQVIDRIYNIQILRTDRDKIDAGLDMVMSKLFPTLTSTLFHAGTQFSGFTDMLAPLLTVLGQMVPTPQQSGVELGEAIERLRAAMPDTGAGPTLNVDVDLSVVPVITAPLLGTDSKGGSR